MEYIFHEKQDGSLCAQHCLNNLLQSPYFSAVDLATFGSKLDEEERKRMAELGDDTEEYQKFIAQPSGNFDDSGYFSVQVISAALTVWGLDLIPYKSSDSRATQAQDSPEEMTAYICNYRDHWFTIRKLGHQWFNLNSLLSGPELVTPTYLSILLAQLQQEGYSIFVVIGDLPPCEADDALKITPAVQVIKPKLNRVTVTSEDRDLEKAIKMSTGTYVPDEDEDMLQEAIKKSLEDEPTDPVLQKAIQMSLDTSKPSTSSQLGAETPKTPSDLPSTNSNDDLKNAIQMSLQDVKEAVTKPRTAQETDVEEIRRRRLAYLDAKAKSGS